LRDRLILLDGWSKTYAMTGWRMGYACGRKLVFPYAERLAINCHSCVNASAQYAGIAALQGPRDRSRMVQAFAERRKFIVAALNSLPGRFAARSGRCVLYVPEHLRHRSRRAHASRAGCSTRPAWRRSPAPAFGAFGEDYVRFSYANSLEAIPRRSSASGGFSATAASGCGRRREFQRHSWQKLPLE
jgi:aspartate aminotransferase